MADAATTISQALAVPEIKALVEAAKEGLTGLVWAMDHLAQHGTVSVSVAVAYDRLDAALAALDPAALATMLAEARADGRREAVAIIQSAGDSAVTEALGQRLCCNGTDCGCRGATVEEYLFHMIDKGPQK